MERLSVMGQLAAGIGHELRNPLTTVRRFLQFFAGNKDMAFIHPQLAIMLTDLDAAHDIISQFLPLARDGVGDAKCLDLNQVVHGVLPLLRADAHLRDCRVIAECRAVPRLWLVEGGSLATYPELSAKWLAGYGCRRCADHQYSGVRGNRPA